MRSGSLFYTIKYTTFNLEQSRKYESREALVCRQIVSTERAVCSRDTAHRWLTVSAGVKVFPVRVSLLQHDVPAYIFSFRLAGVDRQKINMKGDIVSHAWNTRRTQNRYPHTVPLFCACGVHLPQTARSTLLLDKRCGCLVWRRCSNWRVG